MEYLTASFDEICDDAITRGKEAVDFLNELLDKKTIGKDGKERQASFLTVKKEYFKKYLADKMPQPKAKPLSMKEKLALKLKK